MARDWRWRVEELCWLGWIMLNPSVHSDSRYQVVFHESHKRLFFGEWQLKKPFGCGCLPVLSCVITCSYIDENKDGEKVIPKWRRRWYSCRAPEWLFLFALTVLGEMAGDEVKPPTSVLMALCSCCRRCLRCVALNACCFVVLDTAPLFPAWFLVQA